MTTENEKRREQFRKSQRKLRERKKKDGLVSVQFWVTPELKKKLKEFYQCLIGE